MRRLYAVVLALGFAATPAAAASLQATQANIHFNLALKQYQGQKLDEASATLKKALDLVPDHPQANLLSGLIACQRSRFNEAVDPLELAIKSLPGNADAHNNLGVAYFQLGRLAEAEAAWKKVLALEPARHDVAMNLGTLALRRKDAAGAQEAFSRVVKAEPGNARAWSYLAEAAEANRSLAVAAQARAKALELSPTDDAMRLQAGERLYQAGDVSAAAKVLVPLKGKGDATAEFLLGVLAYRMGRFEESRERFEAALKARPDYPEARFNLAITFFDQERYPEALEQFKAVLAEHPEDEEAKRNLDVTRQAAVRSSLKDGSKAFLQADYAVALKRWRQALALEPDNKSVKDLVETAEAQLKLEAEQFCADAQAAWQAGKREEAVVLYVKALDRDPKNSAAKAGLDAAKDDIQKMVYAYKAQVAEDLKEGRLPRARANHELLKALDPGAAVEAGARIDRASAEQYAASLVSAGKAAKKGELNDEMEAWQKALAAKPDDAKAQEGLNLVKVAWRQAFNEANEKAAAAEKSGKKQVAISLYQRVLALQPGNAAANDALKRLRASKGKEAEKAQWDEVYYQGVYAYAGGDVEKAVSLWKKVVAAVPQHRLAKEALNRAQRRKGS